MNAAKFSPRPTGSKIVNRTLPGGTEVRNRSISAWSSLTASALPVSAVLIRTDDWIGNGIKAGSSKLRRPGVLEPGIDGDAAGEVAEVDRELAEGQAPAAPRLGGVQWSMSVFVPVQEAARRFLVDLVGHAADAGQALGPGLDQVVPGVRRSARLVVSLVLRYASWSCFESCFDTSRRAP